MYLPSYKNFRKDLIIIICLLFILGFYQLFDDKQEKVEEFQEFTDVGESSTALTIEDSTKTYTVKRVIDGDTIELEDGTKVRYIGIDTPETVAPNSPVECFGKEASDFNKNLLENKEIRMEKDFSETDRYGRLLRYVYIGDLFVNEYLVKEGYATSATFPPDVKYQDVFEKAESYARKENKGLWASCKF